MVRDGRYSVDSTFAKKKEVSTPAAMTAGAVLRISKTSPDLGRRRARAHLASVLVLSRPRQSARPTTLG